MRILIYGAGVIGSIYAVKFSNAGYDVTVFARSNRLTALENKGLLYNSNNIVKKSNIKVIDKLNPDDIYDYIFVTVRYEQIESALAGLKENRSPNIITMVNNPNGFKKWEEIIGKGKLIPSFAGAGGQIENDILYFQLTPKIVQPTTFGEIGGAKTERIKKLKKLFKTSRIPCSISRNMDAWQKSHLAMVTALANGIYFDGGNNYTTAKNKKAVRFMSTSLKENFKALRKIGIPVTPSKLKAFIICPLWLMDIILRLIYNTKFAETLISSHAKIAKREMEILDKEFKMLVNCLKGAD
ncbi:MAG: NAD-binding protein [Oscillospiraceae bacterium]|nr:NAD-binding protein [Oscillospiraceae bacterium]